MIVKKDAVRSRGFVSLLSVLLCIVGCLHVRPSHNDPLPDMHSGGELRFLPGENGSVVCALGKSINWTMDGGKNWQKRAQLPSPVTGMIAGSKGRVLAWDELGRAYIIDDAGAIHGVIGLDSVYIVSMAANEGLLVAYGKSLHDSIDYDPCFNPEHVMDTSSVAARIYSSVDGGETWKLVDSWPNRYIVDAFIVDRNDIFYLSLYGEIKRAVVRPDGSVSIAKLCGPGKHCYFRTSRLFVLDSVLAYITNLGMSGPYVDEVECSSGAYRKVGYDAFPYNIATSFGKGCVVFDRTVVYLLEGHSRRTLLSVDSMLDVSWSIESVVTDGHSLILVSAMRRGPAEGTFSRVLFYRDAESQWRML